MLESFRQLKEVRATRQSVRTNTQSQIVDIEDVQILKLIAMSQQLCDRECLARIRQTHVRLTDVELIDVDWYALFDFWLLVWAPCG